ncbi:MAG: class I SAM-dependent methyltransferase [Candidatus Sumerlaeia bacterium]|nr:class I SAM-dependent methyltransferase [Candidatus Sumerlaeia bacterium]
MANTENHGGADYEPAACPLCRSADAAVLYLQGPARIARCRACDLVYAAVRPTLEAMMRIYSDSYFHERTQVSEEFVEGRRTLHDILCEGVLRRLPPPRPGDRLLDIGCGIGKTLLHARARGWTVEGIEPSAYASAYAREHLGLAVRTGVFQEGLVPPETFRAVVMLDVIEHFYEPLPMLREIHRILQPGGHLALTTPNVKGLSTRLFGGRNYALDATLGGVGHVTFFSEQTLAAMLGMAGFASVRSWTGEVYVKNVTDWIRRTFRLRQSGGDLHKKARTALRPAPWTVAAYHAVNAVLRLTRLGDQITALAVKGPGGCPTK